MTNEQEKKILKAIGDLKLYLWLLFMVTIAMILFSSCSSVYWEDSRHTASGRHTYYKQGWPYSSSCTVYSQQPIKTMTFKRYSYWRHGNN